MTTHEALPRRLYVSMLTSLDGYIEDAERSLDWMENSHEFNVYADEMIDSVGVALYGRRSYETMVSHWPDAEHKAESAFDLAFARKMNALPKVVLSRTLEHATWTNTRVLKDRVGEQLSELKREGGKPIVAWAGAGLFTTLMELRLVDELRVVVHPLLLGRGTSLFGGLHGRQPLELVRTQQLGERLAVLCYEPVWTGANAE